MSVFSAVREQFAKRGRPPKDLSKSAIVGNQDIYGAISPGLKDLWATLENPDEIIQSKGTQIYDEMLKRDPQVKSAVTLKVAIRMAPTWRIVPASQDSEDMRNKKLVDDNIEFMEGSWDSVVSSGTFGGWSRGVSVQELDWKVFDESDNVPPRLYGTTGWERIRDVYPDNDTWKFNPDPYGLLRPHNGQAPIQQIQSDNKPHPLDPDKFVIYSHQFDSRNWWGTSDLRPIYRPYMIKDFLLRMLGVFAERHAGPLYMFGYTDGTQPGEVDKLLTNMQKGLKLFGVVAKPKSWDHDMWSPSGEHIKFFTEMFAYLDKQIGRGIVVPELLQSEGETHGSYGLGVMQYEGPFLAYMRYVGHIIENIYNEQAIKRLILKNYPGTYKFPTFKWDQIKESPDPNMLKAWELIVTKGWPADQETADQLARTIGLPAPKDLGGGRDDIDKTAGKVRDSVMSQMESDHAQDRLHWSKYLAQLRSELFSFGHAVAPTIPHQMLTTLCTEEVGAWTGQMKALVEEKPETGFADFNLEQALFDFGRKVKEFGRDN